MFTVNREIVKGVLIGVGVSAVGFYAYKKNEEKSRCFHAQTWHRGQKSCR